MQAESLLARYRGTLASTSGTRGLRISHIDLPADASAPDCEIMTFAFQERESMLGGAGLRQQAARVQAAAALVMVVSLAGLSVVLGASELRAAACDALGGDSDVDGICDDGSNSGVAGDAPCSCGPSSPPTCEQSCDDNCRWAYNPDQLDLGGAGGSPPNGIGDVCECGDVTDDGLVDILDAGIYARELQLLPPGLLAPQKCGVAPPGACSQDDVDALRRELAGLLPGIEQVCGTAGPCASDGDCLPAFGCDLDGVCRKLDGESCDSSQQCINECCGGACSSSCPSNLGEPCGVDGDCQSGFCSDGVCCQSRCFGECESCDQAAREGFCDPMPAATDPDGECPTDPVSSCGSTGVCSGSASCALYPVGTVCAPTSCATGTTANLVDACDGAGNCLDGGQLDCAPYVCNAAFGECRASCSSNSDCASGFGCETGAGQCLRADGESCVDDGECVNGACCSDRCSDPSEDESNCGACGSVCVAEHGTNSCVAAMCLPSCDATFGDCDGDANNGCETPVLSLANCGACGVVCDPANASKASCTTGACTVVSCSDGFANCDGDELNGCEESMDTCASGCCASTSAGSYQADNDGCTTRTTRFGVGETCFTVTLREDRDSCHATEGILRLDVPPGVDFDLHVTAPDATCLHWNGASWVSGCNGTNGSGQSEMVFVGRGESCFLGQGDAVDQTMEVTAEIRWLSGGSCDHWSFTVTSGEGC